jgi:heme exporter protein CcmD
MMDELLATNAYTGYLLVAYGVTALVVIGNIMAARHRFHATRQRLQQQLDRRAGRPGARS